MRQLICAALLGLGLTFMAPAVTPLATSAMAQAGLIDINSASKADLDALPGIGAARSDAIIKGRPYKGKDDLVNKKIIPQNVYDGIKDKIIAKQK
jgi:DNA uptake protein ComE-like DNA-binding protein